VSAAALIQSALAAGVQLRLVDGKIRIAGKRTAVDGLLEPLRQHKADLIRWFTQAANDPEPPADPREWRELSIAYHQHHNNCAFCQAAGRGARYGLRCGTGSALWLAYQETSL
jgi:hypothetical protein